MASKSELKVGQVVYFGRSHGEKTKGEIVKVNRVACKVKQLEQRGTYRDYPAGSLWTVPFGLIFLDGEEAKAAEKKPVRPRRRRRYYDEF